MWMLRSSDTSEPFERLAKCRYARPGFRVAGLIGQKHGDPPHPFGLLAAHRERPRSHPPTKQPYELPPPHVEHGFPSAVGLPQAQPTTERPANPADGSESF
jgi:hypothetical protein